MPPEDLEIQQYAEALLALARAADAVPRVEEEVVAAGDLLSGNEELRRFLGDDRVRVEGKREALDKVLGPTMHPALRYFLLMLLEQRRLRRFEHIRAAFLARASQLRNRTTGELISAVPIAEEKVAVIASETGRLLGKDVELRVRVDPELLGGILVKVGDFVIDGTVDRCLEDYRRVLLAP